MGNSNKSNTVRVYDFFSGCGGTSSGFQKAGMEIAYALDNDWDSKASFEANFPNAHFDFIDIQKINIKALKTRVELDRPNLVLFSGCAPCQPFTKQNTNKPTKSEDERIPLLSHFANLIENCIPDLVFLENVPGIQKLEKDNEPLGNLGKILKKLYYEIASNPIIFANYGVPQTRRRFVLIASRHGKIDLPLETHGQGKGKEKYTTVRDWISHLPPIKAGEEDKKVKNHKAARLSKLNLKRIKATPKGGGNRDWPEHLKLNCHKKHSGFSDVYGRLDWDKTASGLTTRCISYSNGRFGHPEQNRAISIREAACLQTFPEDFIFKGNMGSMARQIGNAVPVLLAERIGEHFINHLKDRGKLV